MEAEKKKEYIRDYHEATAKCVLHSLPHCLVSICGFVVTCTLQFLGLDKPSSFVGFLKYFSGSLSSADIVMYCGYNEAFIEGT